MSTMQDISHLAVTCLPTAALIHLLCADDASAQVSCGDSGPASPQRLKHRLEVARELLMRDAKERMLTGPVLSSPDRAAEWLRWHFKDRDREALVAMALTQTHSLIEVTELFQGPLDSSHACVREVVRFALTHNASALVVAHNHPHWHLVRPSKAEWRWTRRLREALAVIDVRLLDHLIVAGPEVLSMFEHAHDQLHAEHRSATPA